MTFMHEGGVAMWVTLLVFVAAGAFTFLRRGADGWRVAMLGALACIASGLAGFATGLYNTVAYAGGVEAMQRAEILGIGLRESAHNVLWGGALAFALVVAAIVVARFARSGLVSAGA